jgi:outer membrane receptor protein involved in Fe transport
MPFPNAIIPPTLISPQAKALLNLYPLPNFTGSTRYNYQLPLVSGQHQDDLQTRLNKQFGRKDQVFGTFALQSIRTDNTNLFGFVDTGRTTGINTNVNWRHNITNRLFGTIGYSYSRFSTRTNPFFAENRNVSGEAGIMGNNQSPANWGPPSLSFSAGTSPLTDAVASLTRNQTNTLTFDGFWSRSRHNVSFGVNLQKQQFNLLSQQNPRGTFTFTGTGGSSDLGAFLLGLPDASQIAFGNADKYLRATNIATYVADDWRVNPGLTLNLGIRYESTSPVTEKYGRLVNLEVGPNFATAAPVIARDSSSPLIQPDRNNFAPRVALSWRPLAASSMVVRMSYGLYYDTSIFQTIATQMAQQAPLSTSIRVNNSPEHPLTLANGFPVIPGALPTYSIDPQFRVGYSQNWQASIQRDIPWGLQLVAVYAGVKGTRAQQQILPNTFPLNAVTTCSTCPVGFTYLESNGNSTRESGQIQVRRRLRSGFTSQLQYTWSKSIDDAILGGRGSLVAQNWRDLSAERGLSNFDQRHVLTASAQYTTGEGLHGGALANGWRAALLKEWTVGTQLNVGSGLPLTPSIPFVVAGTGLPGSLRPDYTGADVTAAPPGLNLNPAAYVPAPAGQYGNAARNSIEGPHQFTLNASMSRTFRSSDRVSLDLRIDANNVLNHVTFPSWVTTVGSAQFGLPVTANSMRVLQTTIRARF